MKMNGINGVRESVRNLNEFVNRPYAGGSPEQLEYSPRCGPHEVPALIELNRFLVNQGV